MTPTVIHLETGIIPWMGEILAGNRVFPVRGRGESLELHEIQDVVLLALFWHEDIQALQKITK